MGTILGSQGDNPNNLAFPTWVLLRNLAFEHYESQVSHIAKSLGGLIGIKNSNAPSKDPRLCVNININEGQVTRIALNYDEGILPPQKTLVDHDKLPCRCRVCLS